MSEAVYENPDGSSLCIDEDYFKNKRDEVRPTAGHFANPKIGIMKIEVW